ncbi:MAG: hypothetical protein NT105_01630 [Verrucomicrobia bacterium]|nr:hypothetical protein [Verrucomicrobiota bacterium]
MLILAQLADIADKTTWLAILIVGLSSPLLGLGGNWLYFRERIQAKRWRYLAVYYGLAILLVGLNNWFPISVIPSPWVNFWELCMVLPLLLLTGIGPVVGLLLLLHQPKKE